MVILNFAYNTKVITRNMSQASHNTIQVSVLVRYSSIHTNEPHFHTRILWAQILGPKLIREPNAGLSAASNRQNIATRTPRHRVPGLGSPGYHPWPLTHPSTHPRLLCCAQRCSLWTSTPTVSMSSSKSCRRKCEHCSCHMSTWCERKQALAFVGQRSVRWGGCVRELAKSGAPIAVVAEHAVSAAPCILARRESSYPARRRVDISTCTSSSAKE